MNPEKPAQAMWDERFRDGARPYGSEPSLYVKEKVGLIRPGGRVLVPGDGGGRNGVWLARQGFQVHVLDYSEEGLRSARQWAEAMGVAIHAEQADVAEWPWPMNQYDAIVSVYLHLPRVLHAGVFRSMIRALKPGGLFLVEGFHVDQLAHNSGGPRDPDLLFSEASARLGLEEAAVLELRRDEVILDESDLHRGSAVLLRLAATRTSG
jgi:SAM-dependent methyltransferase